MLRKEFKSLYRHPDVAFGSMDMTGSGFIDLNKFCSSIVSQKIIENGRKSMNFKIELNDFR